MSKLNPSFYLRRMFNASNLYEWMKANNDLARFFGTRYRYIYKQHMNNTTGDQRDSSK